MTPTQKTVDELILRLYRGCTEVEFSGFQKWSLEQLSGIVRFDAAWWGKSTNQPPLILSVHLQNADQAVVDDYARVDGDDFFRDAMFARPGTTINLHDLMPRKAFERSPLYTRYGRRHRIEAAMGTVLIEPISSLVDFLTIWRHDLRWPFSETDRKILEQLTPHLVEANRISRLVSLNGRRTTGAPDGPMVEPWALARVDDACLLEATAPFIELARREWPEWSTALLPADLRRHFRSCRPFAGQSIRIEIEDVDGYRLLTARPRHALERLGPREAEVLERYANGQSYREIALQLGKSPATVRNQLAQIYRKFGVHNKVELLQAMMPATGRARDPNGVGRNEKVDRRSDRS